MDNEQGDIQGRIVGDPQASGPAVIEIPKRGRGRPPGSTTKTSGSNPRPSGSESGIPSRKDIQREEQSKNARFLATGFVSLIEMVEGLYQNSLVRKVEKKLPSKLEEFKAMCRDISLTEKEKEILTDSGATIIERHDFLTSNAPEWILAITLGQFGARTLSLGKFVANVTAEAKKSPAGTPLTPEGKEIKPVQAL